MPDMISPVGTMIKPPDPMQGINTLSGIYGIQQQRQQLQTGAYQQQTAQAEAQQSQQKNQELAAAQQVALNGAKSGKYTKPDGTFDRMGLADDIMHAAPTYGSQAATPLLSQANEIVANQQAHQNLTASRKQEIGNTFASLAADPQVDNTKFIDAIETLRQQHPNDPEFSRMLTSMSTHMPNTGDSAALQSLAGRWAAAATGTPQTQPGQVDVGGQVIPGATNRFSGQFTPAQQGIQKTLAPTQTLPYIAGAATAQGAAAGQVGTDNQLFTKVMASGANAQRGVELAQNIQKEAAQVRTGKYSQEFANRLTVLQQHDPTLTAIQLLQKDAANLKSLAEEGATTDAERSQIGGGYPSPEIMGPDALQKAARYWEGAFHMAGARSQNAIAHVSQNGSTAGLTVKDQGFMSSASPGKFAPKIAMPTGAKLNAYAAKYFGGDTAKATAHLKQEGYE